MLSKHHAFHLYRATVFSVGTFSVKTSLQIQDSNNADVLLDSGLKLSDIIVILCSKLLDYILLNSGSRY